MPRLQYLARKKSLRGRVLVSRGDAVASAEQALTVLLADLTKDKDVAGAMATIEAERTPFYAALVRPASARGSRPPSVSPTEDRPTSPAEAGTAGLNGQGRAVSPITGDAGAAPEAAGLDITAEMQRLLGGASGGLGGLGTGIFV